MRLHHEGQNITLWHGDATDVAAHLEPGSVQAVVTSPPYWGLRDYGSVGQLGAETDVRECVANLVVLLGEVRKVMADDGVLWLNLGDTYQSSGGTIGVGPNAKVGNTKVIGSANRTRVKSSVPNKSLVGLPWRVALELIDDGWVLRSDVVWAKSNPMPESVKDRPTRSHEYLFMFTKSQRYYYDRDAIAEPTVSTRPSGNDFKRDEQRISHGEGSDKRWEVAETRNARDVWTFPTQPFRGAHFAVFPPELPRRCIRSSSRPGDLVLDPFSGSGTTGMVALEEGRHFVGIDMSADYLDLSLSTRLKGQPA